MSKVYPYVRTVVSGTVAAGQTFSWGISTFPTALNLTQTELDSLNQDITTAALATPLAAGGAWLQLLGPDGAYRKIQSYYYAANATSATLVSAPSSFAAKTGTGNNSTPNDTAIVVSLRSNLPGRHGRGRVYLPADGATGSTHQLSSPGTNTVATEFANFLKALNLLSVRALPVQVIIASSLPVGAVVTAVNVDSKFDTQRRRENKILPIFNNRVTV